MTALPLTNYAAAALALPLDGSDAADIRIECGDYVRFDEPGRLRPGFGYVESVKNGQVLISNRFGARWVTADYVIVMLKVEALDTLDAELEKYGNR